MELQYYLMKGLLMFIVLFFGFILFLYFFFLGLHSKDKTKRIIIGTFGIALILFFLIYSGWIKICWDSVILYNCPHGEYCSYHPIYHPKVFSFSDYVPQWQKFVSESPLWKLLWGFMLSLFFAFVGFVVGYLDFRDYVRNTIKELNVFTLEDIVIRGFRYALCLVVGIFCLFQLGSFTMAIGYKLFY
jgi:hypothetical protein